MGGCLLIDGDMKFVNGAIRMHNYTFKMAVISGYGHGYDFLLEH